MYGVPSMVHTARLEDGPNLRGIVTGSGGVHTP
jgi:hypothetical protein